MTIQVPSTIQYAEQDVDLIVVPVNRPGPVTLSDQPHFLTAIMRKTDVTQHSLYSYRTLEERIPEAHP